MSEYLQTVLQASGGHAAPEEVLIEDSQVEEAALEKEEDDPCWSGYVQVGMKEKNGKRVPNCVPSSAAINFLIEDFNSKFGSSRHVSKESAYAVAQKALDKYDHLDDSALYSAVLWELHVFSEYATSGATDVEQDFSVYSEYLPDGHPAVESSLTASAAWVAGASELDNSGREALLTAFSEDTDYVKSLHASTRVRAMVSSGSLTDKTLQYIKNLSDKHSKVS